MNLNYVNQTIIDIIVLRAQRLCPDALELIAVYGSVLTGDDHEKSDLDLLILIGDECGRQLGTGFILDDIGVGYDIYTTGWSQLEADAACPHANIAKLMDSEIVYTRRKEAVERLQELREEAGAILSDPIARHGRAEEAYRKAEEAFRRAKVAYRRTEEAFSQAEETYSQAEVVFVGTKSARRTEGDDPAQNAPILSDSHSQQRILASVRLGAADILMYILDALMLQNGCYFHYGVRRNLEELAAVLMAAGAGELAEELVSHIRAIVLSDSPSAIIASLSNLLALTREHLGPTLPQTEMPTESPSSFTSAPAPAPAPASVSSETPELLPASPSAANISGTYEEMFSNWRNKMADAAARGDVYSSFMNLASLQAMINEIAEEVDLSAADKHIFTLMGDFEPENLGANIRLFDAALADYLKVYDQAGTRPNHYESVDAFAANWL